MSESFKFDMRQHMILHQPSRVDTPSQIGTVEPKIAFA